VGRRGGRECGVGWFGRESREGGGDLIVQKDELAEPSADGPLDLADLDVDVVELLHQRRTDRAAR
jgi:hypothetical protein